MSSLGSKQTGVPGLSARATVGHLGRAQHPAAPLLSDRAALGHLGIARRYTDTTGLLHTRRLLLPAPPPPDFTRLRADAQRLKQQLAAHDSTQVAAAPAPHPAPFHTPMMTPAIQARLQQEQAARIQRRRTEYGHQILAAYNKTKQAAYMSGPLRKLQMSAQLSLLNELGMAPAGQSKEPDLFMPKTFWHTQYQKTPTNWKSIYVPARKGHPAHWSKFDHWRDCCNTCKRMIKQVSGAMPSDTRQIVLEQGGGLVATPETEAGLAKIDTYMRLHKPVMVGVTFAYGLTYNNDKTSDHFVVLVGAGIEHGRKYYRFFDVGTQHQEKGTNPDFKLYQDPANHSYSGNGLLGHYTLSQARFQR